MTAILPPCFLASSDKGCLGMHWARLRPKKTQTQYAVEDVLSAAWTQVLKAKGVQKMMTIRDNKA